MGKLFPLHEAVRRCDIDRINRLIKEGSDLNVLDDLGMSPLHWAVYGGYLECARVLLSQGADPSVRSTGGTTPLWHAEDDFGLSEIAKLLREFGASK